MSHLSLSLDYASNLFSPNTFTFVTLIFSTSFRPFFFIYRILSSTFAYSGVSLTYYKVV